MAMAASMEEPRHTGTLEKKSAGRFSRSWTPLYARLTDHQLSLHKSETDLAAEGNPVYLQNLADDWDKHAYTGDEPRLLTLTMKDSVSKKPFIFRTEDREDSTLVWIEKINEAKKAGRSTAEMRRKKSRGTMVEVLSPGTRKKTKLSVLRRGTRQYQLEQARERRREHLEAMQRRYHPQAIMEDDSATDHQTLASLEETALALLGDIDGDGVADELKRGEPVDILHGEHTQMYTAENPDAVVQEVIADVGLVVVKVRGVCRIMPLHYVRRAISVMRASDIQKETTKDPEQEEVDKLEASKRINFKEAPDTFADAPSIEQLEADGKYRNSGVDIVKLARHNGMHGELKRKGMELRHCWYDNFFLLKLDCFELRYYKRKPQSRQQTYDLLEGVVLLTGAKIEMPQKKKKKKDIENSFAIRAEMHHGEPRYKKERLIQLRASGPEEFAQWMGGISYAIRCAEIKQDRLVKAAGKNLQELKDVQKIQHDLLDKVKDWDATPARQDRSDSGRGAHRGETDVKDAIKKALESGIKQFQASVPRQLEALVMSKGGELTRENLVDIAKAMQTGRYRPKDSHGKKTEEIALVRRRTRYLKPYDNAFTIPEALEWLAQHEDFRKYCVSAGKATKDQYDEDDTDQDIGKAVIDELVDAEFIRHIRDRGGDDKAGQDKSRSFVGLYQLRMENVMDGKDQVLDKMAQTMTQGDLARMVRAMQDDAKLLKSQKMGSQSKCMRGTELLQWMVSDDNSDIVYWTTNQGEVDNVKRSSQRHGRTGRERVYHVRLCDTCRESAGSMADLLAAFEVHEDVQQECTGEAVAEKIINEMLQAVLLEPCNSAGKKLAATSFGSPSQLRKNGDRFAVAKYYLPGHNFDLLVRAGVEFSDERKTD